MDDVVGHSPSDDLRSLIATARADLGVAQNTPSLRRDPYRIVLVAMSETLAVFGRSVERWERAVEDVIAARDPLPEEDRQALRAELVRAVEDGAYRGMRKEVGRMVRTLDRKLSAQIGLAIGSAAIAGALLVLGVQATINLGPFSRESQRNAAWQALTENNPDPRPAMALAEIHVDHTGRRYYSGLALWLDPSLPPNVK